MNAFPVRPKQEAQFSITIAPADLPRGAVTCEIDMVNEGAYWFNERGAASLTVPLSGFHNANSRNDAIAELVKASRSANDDERRKLAVLAQVLRNYDFLGYEGIARLGQMIRMRLSGKSYRQPVISSTTTSTMQRRNRERRQSAYFESFAAKFGNFRNGLPTDPVEYVDLFKRMVQDSNSFFRNSAPPLPPRLTQWLNSRALPAQLSSMPVSRSMIATLDDNMAIHFNRHQDFLNLMWRYITSVMIDHNLPVSLVPDPVIRAYATSPESCDDEEAFPQQTGFMARLLNDDAGYQSRYDAPLPQPESFEVYPNRDSYPFMEDYRFDPAWKVRDFVRGTIRLNGWADAWAPVFREIETLEGPAGEARLAEMAAEFLAANAYAPGEPDRVILFVSLRAERGGRAVFHETWAMDAWGDARGTAMGRLVSVPVSLAVESVLAREIPAGVHAAPHEPRLLARWLGEVARLAQYLQRVDHLT